MKTYHMFFVVFVLGCLLLPQRLASQSTAPDKNSPEFHQFDFWVGEWEASWLNTAKATVKGTNSIKKTLDDAVIYESFSDPTNKFYGQSWSVYNPQRKLWQQTWVDNQGGYLDFTGGMNGGRMILSRSFVGPKGKTVHQRMVFYDILKNSFNWSWESSTDEGKSWKQQWLIQYKRKS